MLTESTTNLLNNNGDQDDQEKASTNTRVYHNHNTLQYFDVRSPETILFHLDNSLDEVDEICRICLNSGSVPIFGGEGSVDISEHLKHFASIDVSEDDCLPQVICIQCQEFLKSAIHFREIAQKSDIALRNKGENQQSQNDSIDIINYQVIKWTSESSDAENSENGVYLEYAETVNENGSTSSEIEESNASIKDNFSNLESAESDSESLKNILDSFKKNARFLKCEVCNIIFRTSEQVNEHSSVHKPEEIITCEVCKNIIHKDVYNIHLKLHREFFNHKMKHKKVECTVCKKHVLKSYIKRHIAMHSTDERNARYKKCTFCDKSISVNYFDNHIKRMHMQRKVIQNEESIPKVKCPICYRMFKESTYKNHVVTHGTRQKRHVCEQCGKEFYSLSTLTTHLLTHKEEYKYKCQFCPYRGKHLGLLKVHVRTHTRDYAYKCTECNASFITKSNLNAHERTHSPGVQFVCSECGKCYTMERRLRTHMISCHEGIKPFSCDICGKSYGSKDVMVAHKRRIHHVAYVRSIGRKPSYLLGQENNKGEDVDQN